ncbi:MAG TPA: response regulator [Ktedonobacteraceae bacterium]|jgi:DNA-binding NtrC family response regulator
MDTAQVLLVDDDPMLLQALSQTIALRMSTVNVRAVSSAQEALDLLQEGQSYGAVVSDIKMPGMDGLALLAYLQDRHAEIPVLLITGHSDHQMAVRALRGGAYDYILKPIEREDFLAALYRALHTHQLQQQIEEQQRALERYALSLERLVRQRTHELAQASGARETLLRGLLVGLRSLLTSLEALAQGIGRDVSRGEKMRQILEEVAQLRQYIGQMEQRVSEAESVLDSYTFA